MVDTVVVQPQETGPEAPVVVAPAPATPVIPEKFLKDGKPDVDALAAAYAELEKKLGGEKPAAHAADSPEALAAAKAAEDAQKAATEAMKVAGLDMKDFSTEFAEKGELSQESYTKLAAGGFPKEIVDTYIRGLSAPAVAHEVDTKAILETIGGQETYTKVAEWALANLPAEEVAAYDNIMNTGDKYAVSLAVKDFHAKYVAANGKEPAVVVHGGGAPAADVFRSHAEITKAMRDPRYAKDPAYRSDVEQKVMRSNI